MSFRSEEWLNQNRYRAYPFVEDASLEATGGALTLANDCVVDASLVSYNIALADLHLASLAVAGDGSTVTFTFVAGATSMVIIVPGVFTGIYEGRVTVSAGGRLSRLLRVKFAEGVPVLAANLAYRGNTYAFTTARMEPAVSVQQISTRVSSINGYTGTIYFSDGYNSSVSLLAATNVLRFSAIVGGGLGVSCDPLPGEPPGDCSQMIYYINGRHPDWLGRFFIRGAGGLTVQTDPTNYKIILGTGIDVDRPGCKDPGTI